MRLLYKFGILKRKCIVCDKKFKSEQHIRFCSVSCAFEDGLGRIAESIKKGE